VAATLTCGGKHGPVLVYNASASAPIGFYRVLPAFPMRRGDLVLVPVPDAVAGLAAERGYIPLTVPLVKRVAATAGAIVCALDRRVTIDGRHVADQLVVDRKGRRLPAWSGCRRLGRGEIFILMTAPPDSFDSRYFGPVSAAAVIGRLEPLWLR
jgi:conjugative transfer signal peptidase TraF